MADARPLLRIRGGIKAQSVWLCRGGRASGGGREHSRRRRRSRAQRDVPARSRRSSPCRAGPSSFPSPAAPPVTPDPPPEEVSVGGNASRGIHKPGVRQHPAVGTTGGPNPAPHSWAGAPGGWAMETFGPPRAKPRNTPAITWPNRSVCPAESRLTQPSAEVTRYTTTTNVTPRKTSPRCRTSPREDQTTPRRRTRARPSGWPCGGTPSSRPRCGAASPRPHPGGTGDLDFLNEKVWPGVQASQLSHDAYTCEKSAGSRPFPTRRPPDYQHVGQVFWGDGRPRMADITEFLLNTKAPQKCRGQPTWESG